MRDPSRINRKRERDEEIELGHHPEKGRQHFPAGGIYFLVHHDRWERTRDSPVRIHSQRSAQKWRGRLTCALHVLTGRDGEKPTCLRPALGQFDNCCLHISCLLLLSTPLCPPQRTPLPLSCHRDIHGSVCLSHVGPTNERKRVLCGLGPTPSDPQNNHAGQIG